MAILTCSIASRSLGRFSPITAILPVPKANALFDFSIEDPYDLKPFKTLYLLHGLSDDCTAWLTGTRVARYAAEKGIAVIMPSGENGFYTDHDEGNRYGEYIGSELIRATRTMFNLSHRREDTYIAGLSMGGYGALRNAMKYNETFSKAGAFSAALICKEIFTYTDDAPRFHRRREYFERVFGKPDAFTGGDNDVYALAEKYAKTLKFYISCGTEDFLIENNRDFAAHMNKLGAGMLYIEEPGGHEWDFWDRHIKRFIEWL